MREENHRPSRHAEQQFLSSPVHEAERPKGEAGERKRAKDQPDSVRHGEELATWHAPTSAVCSYEMFHAFASRSWRACDDSHSCWQHG
jgi:hypothetical protein